ncbi:hypothetical protein AB0B89_36310 [Sphaerisporangium sp. NPDC049002]|uniref:hypothetical protein n=1 Tax=Sphaerisporangium sp. NPDC049002 TaxID=3155392 RepID=UPI0033D507EF
MNGYHQQEAEVLALAGAVAEQLRSGYEVVRWEPPRKADLPQVFLISGQHRILLHYKTWGEYRKDRLTFSGLRPSQEFNTNHYLFGPAVTIGMSRTTDAIAADLQRRLLPAYHEYVAKELRRREMYESAKAGCVDEARRLAGLIPGAKHHPGSRVSPERVLFNRPAHGYGAIHVAPDRYREGRIPPEGMVYTLSIESGRDVTPFIDDLAQLIAKHFPPAETDQ